MIIGVLAHIVGLFGGAVVGILAGWLMAFLVILLMGAVSRGGKASTMSVFTGVFLLSGLISILMVFISAFIVGLFKIQPSWVVLPVYVFLLWMARNHRYPQPWMNFAFNGGCVCGLIVGGILFLA
ncbi:MAG: hypothetical protein ABII20_04880 [Candidatus Omnitrophota bacterium]|nr:hypothetical protein [bacterium]MBU4123317.1 hypothetical protein [bacterium]